MKFQWRSNPCAICPGQPVCSEQEWEETAIRAGDLSCSRGPGDLPSHQTGGAEGHRPEMKSTFGGGHVKYWKVLWLFQKLVRKSAIFEGWAVCRLRWILSQIWGEKEAVKCKLEGGSHSQQRRSSWGAGDSPAPRVREDGGSFSCLSGRTLALSAFLSFHLWPALTD